MRPVQPGYGLAEARTCPDCVTDCQEPSCTAAEMTSQCTDQCVVVACTDPTHGEMSCHAPMPCDATCDGMEVCSDSTGFDDVLQCCTDYHSYLSDPRIVQLDGSQPSGGNQSEFDASFDAFLCECGIPIADGKQYQPVMNDEKYQYLTPSNQNHTYLPQESLAFQSQHPSFPPQTSNYQQSFTPLPSVFNCMWANCQSQFSSLNDLVGHVNYHHLRLPVPTHGQQSEMQSNSLSCLWGDCNVYQTMESIPGSSGGNQNNVSLGVLASHLMQDHLGLISHASFPPSTSPQFQSDLRSASPLSQSTSSFSASPSAPVHCCVDTNACHWKSCSDSFSSCNDLTAHISSVHIGGGKPHYDCFWEGCDRNGEKGFTSKQKICRHLQTHTGHRPFQCQVCKQNFSEAATLQQHMRRHTQEKPYICNFPGCGKAFAITGALTIHKRTHNGLKPFKCTYCDKCFSESSNLSKHLRTHTGIRPYLCTEDGCGKSFARPDQLARHMGVHRKPTKTSRFGGNVRQEQVGKLNAT